MSIISEAYATQAYTLPTHQFYHSSQDMRPVNMRSLGSCTEPGCDGNCGGFPANSGVPPPEQSYHTNSQPMSQSTSQSNGMTGHSYDSGMDLASTEPIYGLLMVQLLNSENGITDTHIPSTQSSSQQSNTIKLASMPHAKTHRHHGLSGISSGMPEARSASHSSILHLHNPPHQPLLPNVAVNAHSSHTPSIVPYHRQTHSAPFTPNPSLLAHQATHQQPHPQHKDISHPHSIPTLPNVSNSHQQQIQNGNNQQPHQPLSKLPDEASRNISPIEGSQPTEFQNSQESLQIQTLTSGNEYSSRSPSAGNPAGEQWMTWQQKAERKKELDRQAAIKRKDWRQTITERMGCTGDKNKVRQFRSTIATIAYGKPPPCLLNYVPHSRLIYF